MKRHAFVFLCLLSSSTAILPATTASTTSEQHPTVVQTKEPSQQTEAPEIAAAKILAETHIIMFNRAMQLACMIGATQCNESWQSLMLSLLGLMYAFSDKKTLE